MRKLQTIALAGSLVLSLAVAPSAQAKANPKAFNGKTCTIVGTSKSEKLTGTPKADVICGLGGNDTISGAGGNDTIDGGAGNDKLSGGDGNDAIDGGAGNDVISGQKGNDALTGDNGNDSLNGGDGNDTLQGETGADLFIGGAGADTATYSDKTKNLTLDIDNKADDGIAGEKDNIKSDVENITGGKGNDAITGSSGVNVISGGTGTDTINGGAGNDSLNGNSGNDVLTGDAGDDTMDGGPGADTFFGGTGVNPCKGNGASWDAGDNLDYMSCEDVTPPRIVSFSVTPSNVDTRSAAATFSHILRIEDDLSGFPACGPDGYTSMTNFAGIFYRNNGQQQGGNSPQYPILPNAIDSCSSSYNGAETVINNLTGDGRVLDITMTVNTTLPRFSRLGNWDAFIEMRDITTNYSQVTMSGPVNGG